MNTRRAREIASSPEMIDVSYNGKLVYIEDVISEKDTASIHYLDQPEYSRYVSLTQLVESKTK